MTQLQSKNLEFVDRLTLVHTLWILECSQRDLSTKLVHTLTDISQQIFTAHIIKTFNFFNSHPGITSFCNAMRVISDDPMRSLSRWIRFIYNVDTGSCSNYDYAGFIQWASDTNWNNPGTSTGSTIFNKMSLFDLFSGLFSQFVKCYTCNALRLVN